MEPKTVQEQIFWSYANLAMAHSAVSDNATKYSRIHYIVRARLYKGLTNGTMSIRSIIDDEKIKINQGGHCAYCHATEGLSADHLIPKYRGGEDSAENIVCACRACNSSKGKKDLLLWYNERELFPPLMILRRYLKLAYAYAIEHNLMDKELCELDDSTIPFRYNLLPTSYPQPIELTLV